MSKGTIMVVEDEVVVGADIREKLEQLGYMVCPIVRYGEKVLDAALMEKPDLILMDIKLKGNMDGVEAARNVHRHLNVPVVFITSYSDNDTLSSAKAAEPYGYIRKPISMEDLRINIEIALYKAEMEQKLQESEERYRLLAHNMNDVVFIQDVNLKIIYTSPSVTDMFGYSPEETYVLDMKELMTENSFIKAIKSFQKYKALAKGKRDIDMPLMEYEYLRKDGSTFWGELKVTFLCEPEGQFIGSQGAIRDITKRKKAEAERERLIDDLQVALKEINTLSGLLPICSFCKKIRDDNGHWNTLEKYIQDRSTAHFSHGICPNCAKKYYPDLDI